MKKIVFLVLLVVLHISTFAQNNQERKLPGYKTSFETNKFWDNWFISLNLGAARFRLSQRFDLNLEYGGIILDDDLVTRGGFPNDGISNLSVGVTFRFKNRSFKKAVSQKQYADLQNLAKAQDARIKELISRTPDTVVKVVKQEVPTTETNVVFKALPTTINFAFNSYKIDPTQEVGVYNLVQFMKENPEVRVRLTGFADKRGTEKANMIISEKRVNGYKNEFVLAWSRP